MIQCHSVNDAFLGSKSAILPVFGKQTLQGTTLGNLDSHVKNGSVGTSLVVQWLRIRLPMQGTWI